MIIRLVATHAPAPPAVPAAQLALAFSTAKPPAVGAAGVTTKLADGVTAAGNETSPAVKRITVWNAPKVWSPVVASDAITVATTVTWFPAPLGAGPGGAMNMANAVPSPPVFTVRGIRVPKSCTTPLTCMSSRTSIFGNGCPPALNAFTTMVDRAVPFCGNVSGVAVKLIDSAATAGPVGVGCVS